MPTAEPESIHDASDGQRPPESDDAVLLLSSAMAEEAGAACGSLLGVDTPATTDYLAVSLQDDPGERIEHWRRHVDPELPDRTGIVCCGETTRSAATATDGGSVRFPGRDVQIASVSSPGDLTGLGMRISDCLEAWAGDENRTVVCVDSLTTVLQYVDAKRAFQFLHVLLARLESVGAAAHVHLDPRAHDDRTVATLSSLFDVVVRWEDGDCVVE